MWQPKIRLILTAIAVGAELFAVAVPAKADGPRWRSCLGHRSSEWAAEAAALGVVGGAPALGYSGCITGYELGIIRIPFPAQPAEGAVATPSGAPSGAIVPPPPAANPGPSAGVMMPPGGQGVGTPPGAAAPAAPPSDGGSSTPPALAVPPSVIPPAAGPK
jgi:hypothetical protein